MTLTSATFGKEVLTVVWYKRPFQKLRPKAVPRRELALRPWGDAAFLASHHLPLCVEGEAEQVLVALRSLVREARAHDIPIFLQEGHKPFLALDAELEVPRMHHLPPVRSGTTPETVAQTLAEVLEWQEARETAEEGIENGWPVLLLCSGLGAHRDTILSQVQALGGQVGLVYVQRTHLPYLERPQFPSQLYCLPDGRAQLRRFQSHQSLQFIPTVHSPQEARVVRTPTNPSVA